MKKFQSDMMMFFYQLIVVFLRPDASCNLCFYDIDANTHVSMDYAMDSLMFINDYYNFDILVLLYDYFYDSKYSNHDMLI